MELDDATWIHMSEEQIRLAPWFKHSTATFEQLHAEDKAGVHLIHRPDDKHHEHDRQWILDGDESADDNPMVVDAFQACLFEDGNEVPGRYRKSSVIESQAFAARHRSCGDW